MTVIGSRFLLLSRPSSEAGFAPAVDLTGGQRCLVAWAPAGAPSAAALHAERALLAALATEAGAPGFLAWDEGCTDGPTLLAITPPAGVPLVERLHDDGALHPIAGARAARWARSLLHWLRLPAVRASGGLLLDPRHLLVTPADTLSFSRLLSTPSPLDEGAQSAQLGHLLYLLTTGRRYDPASPWTRHAPATVNHTVPTPLSELILALLAGEGTSLAVLEHQLAAAGTSPRRALPPGAPSVDECASLAAHGADRLAATIEQERVDLTLYRGIAGRLLVLTEAARALDEQRWTEAIARGAARLMGPLPAFAHSGSLYFGEAGVAYALVRAGEFLADERLVARGVEGGRALAALPHSGADLVWGAAGRLRFQLWLAAWSGDSIDVAAAEASAAWILAACGDGPYWLTPGVEGAPYLGYGHGSAGIGDALLDLYLARPSVSLRAAIEAIVDDLTGRALALEEGGANWPKTTGDDRLLTQWCHGATGIAPFLLRAAAPLDRPELVTLARRGLRGVADRSGYLSPCGCHGLAGSIEALLDEGGPSGPWAPEIARLWSLLDGFRVVHENGLSWRNHHLAPDDSALMTGYGAVIHCLLRLADPARPRLLSLKGMRYGHAPRYRPAHHGIAHGP